MYKTNPLFAYDRLEDGMAVYDAVQKRTHILNETAAIVIDKNGDEEAIVIEICKRFTMQQHLGQVRQDIRNIIDRLVIDKILIDEDKHYV